MVEKTSRKNLAAREEGRCVGSIMITIEGKRHAAEKPNDPKKKRTRECHGGPSGLGGKRGWGMKALTMRVDKKGGKIHGGRNKYGKT